MKVGPGERLRRGLLILVLAVMCLPCVGAESMAAKKALVVVTTWPVFALTKQLASGTGIGVDLLMPSELGCPHHHSLTPGDLQKLTQANLILAVGAGFEPFLPRLAGAMPGVPLLEVASGLPMLAAIDAESEATGNPHVFSSPEGMKLLGEKVAAILGDRFPVDQAQVLSHAAALSRELGQSAAQWQEASARIGSLAVIITHDSLDYVARDLGLVIVERLEEGEGEGLSVSRLLSVKQAIKDRGVRAILVDSQHPSKAAETLSRETGIPVTMIDTMTIGPREPGQSLADRFQATAEQLVALAGTR